MIFYKSAMKINGGNNTQMVYCPQMVLGQLDNYMQKEQIWIPNSHHIQKLPQNRSFCIQCELGIQIYSFACKYPVVPAPFVYKSILSSNDCHQFSSVAQVCLTLRHHGLQHARLPYPSPIPRAYSNSCPCSQWSHPTISSSVVPFSSHLQSFPASGSFPMSRFFTSWPKYWSFSFSISLSNDYSGLISFKIDRLDLLAVQGTLKNLLQHHSSKASVLQCSVFFVVQLSQPYMTTGKTIALTGWTFVGKVMSLLFNMLSRLAIAFLPRSKHLLI